MSDLETAKTTVKRMQKVVFKIMCDIDDYCKNNNIRYFLSGGTCLGAVRHKGFIPWDDDGDLMMPRPDYEKFICGFSKAFEGKYIIGSLLTDPCWQRPYCKICDTGSKVVPKRIKENAMGIFVDIFPIDGLPKGKVLQHIHYEKLRIFNALRNSSVRNEFNEQERYRLFKLIASIVTKKVGPRFFAELIDNAAKKFSFYDSDEVGAVLAMHYWDKETIEKQYMERACYLPFENRMLPVPIGYDKYLQNLYGDYMKIPKDAEEKGYSHLDHWTVEFLDE